MRKKECIAMLLAGGQGSRLGCLTRNIAKPAVSFAGKYRIIDFSLSNCTHSNIDTVGVLTQYKPFVLNSYIGMGSAWDLNCLNGGVHILPPFLGEDQGSWYKGTANAIYQNMDFINFYNPEYILILSGDHIYQMNYYDMLSFHKQAKAEVTLSTIAVPWEEASRFGVMTADESGRISEFAEKPVHPQSNLASMGVYIFNWEVLKEALWEDEADEESVKDFGKNVIPRLLRQGKRIYSYLFHGYWRDVGTIESYYNANMEVLREEKIDKFFELKKRIFSNEEILAPHYIGAEAKIHDSLIGNGCTILGDVHHSIISAGVYVGKGSLIEDSIVLPNAEVRENVRLWKTILGENAVVQDDCYIGAKSEDTPAQEGITVIGDHLKIPRGSVIGEGKNVTKDDV
ncbi:glucose-1-phosphate adenylyltransferase [Desulfitobacterium dichloroeliminans LMG P-21439]|uniref:Glucose-1-phosphate adenylyltransferase n=1 Tax=Desulfitobacterium dichloroeliminans (strain LMG P-21439 / DCA1) TaxID=871963 RepID=L0F9F0_DESDL|nr:glucose-1-phosphate adenylyltransferase [Desulfitobacterium dichloroeliminans]AGA69645.1 glucose-1-phosphate adenylyltransferase [Desulfitobacterium dichloroeliminans LMG P-21439]